MADRATHDTIRAERGPRQLLVFIFCHSAKLVIVRLEDDLAWVVPWPIVLAQIVLIKLIVLLGLSSILLLLFLSLVPIETRSLDRVMHILVLKLSASPIGLNWLLPFLLSFAI